MQAAKALRRLIRSGRVEGTPVGPFGPAAETRAGRRSLTPDGRLRTGRLAGLSVNRAIWVLSWPILIESLLNSLVGLTDTVLATQIGEAETDAIGGAAYIGWFIGLIIMAIGVGSTALISRAVGGGRIGVANAGVGQTVLLQAVTGLGVAVLLVLMAEPVAASLNMSERATEAFVEYLRIIAIATPFMALVFGCIACSRGAGDSFRPLGVMVIVNLVNIVSSWVLAGVDISVAATESAPARTILANPFGFDMGVRGIAAGTLIAHIVGAGLMLWILISGKTGVQLKRRWLRPHWHTIRRLVRIGLPNFFETFGMWFGNFLVLLMVGWLAMEGLLGAHIVAIRIEAFSFLPGFAMGTAAATLAGQYLGAGSMEMAKRAVFRCTLVGASLMGLMGAAFVLFPRQIVGVFTTQPTHLEVAPDLLVLCGLVQVPFALAIVFRGAMRGAGDVKACMVITWITTYGVRLPFVYLLSGVEVPIPFMDAMIPHPLGLEPSLRGVWAGMCLELLIRGLIFSVRFARGKWMFAKV